MNKIHYTLRCLSLLTFVLPIKSLFQIRRGHFCWDSNKLEKRLRWFEHIMRRSPLHYTLLGRLWIGSYRQAPQRRTKKTMEGRRKQEYELGITKDDAQERDLCWID
ncbi:hypothetical protein Y032_0006g2842 [Ancylostoma ceylanicum]|uniref:Uncharacterized protein n=1 Tax=Ancylostoma ceylanicum TaxID=53326 RepID=A0A016VPG4_9BILA|nr:hypothetical protein Y032_0006g2842 [Ancylostoma ceylanicum]